MLAVCDFVYTFAMLADNNINNNKRRRDYEK